MIIIITIIIVIIIIMNILIIMIIVMIRRSDAMSGRLAGQISNTYIYIYIYIYRTNKQQISRTNKLPVSVYIIMRKRRHERKASRTSTKQLAGRRQYTCVCVMYNCIYIYIYMYT